MQNYVYLCPLKYGLLSLRANLILLNAIADDSINRILLTNLILQTMKKKLTLLLFSLLFSMGIWAQLTSISDGTLTTWAFQRVDNGASGWIDGDFKNNGATKDNAACFKFEYAGSANTYYIIDVSTGNYVYASNTTKSTSSSDSRLAKGGSLLPASEDDSKPQVDNLKAYKWVLHYNESVAGKSYGSKVWDIAPYQNANLRLALWTQNTGSTNNIIFFDAGYNIAYFRLFQPSVGALINANLTFGQIKAQGYTGDDIAEYYKPTYLDKVGWPTTAAWTTFKKNINALADDAVISTAYATPYQTMCTTVLAPQLGKFYRITDKDGNTVYAPGINTQLLTAASVTNPVSSVFYIAGDEGTKRIVSFLNGYYLYNTSSTGTAYVRDVPGANYSYQFDHITDHQLGALRIKNNFGDCWYSYNGININSQYNTGANRAFYFEPLTSLPITMNLSDGAYYATINLPVAVTIPLGLSAYSATAAGEVLTLTKVVEDGVLAANTPVILYSESSVTSLDIASTAGTAAVSNELEGTTAAISVTANQNYVLNCVGGQVGFYLCNGTAMPGFKAYLPSSATSNVKAFTFSFEDAEDAIRAIESENSGLEIYDISGCRVQKAQKGLYIVNGKKVMYK